MSNEGIFRTLLIISGIAMMTIRIYYQRKVLPERKRTTVKGNPLGLIPGAIAALVTFTFGLEYIFAPGTFSFACAIEYPVWLRWVGVIMLVLGISLLGAAHHHLGRSFHSLVALKEGQVLVDTGPYRYIRHPIYTAYILNYVGGGLLSANWILTLFPVFFFALMICFRIGEEEEMLIEEFGERYREYMRRTGRLLPFM